MTTTINGTRALEPRYQHPSAVRNHGVDCTGNLEEGELLTGTPVVTPAVLLDNRTAAEIAALPTPTALTISNEQRNAGIKTVNSKRVPIDQAVLFTCSGGSDGVDYLITVSCATDSSPAETIVGTLELRIRD